MTVIKTEHDLQYIQIDTDNSDGVVKIGTSGEYPVKVPFSMIQEFVYSVEKDLLKKAINGLLERKLGCEHETEAECNC